MSEKIPRLLVFGEIDDNDYQSGPASERRADGEAADNMQCLGADNVCSGTFYWPSFPSLGGGSVWFAADVHYFYGTLSRQEKRH